MLSDAQDDLLGLAFNIGALPFFNVALDISAIDLSDWGAAFLPASGSTPVFQFSLYDNPGGTPGIGGSTLLDSFVFTGAASSSRYTFKLEPCCLRSRCDLVPPAVPLPGALALMRPDMGALARLRRRRAA